MNYFILVADKFGNISIVRLPQNVNDNVDDDPTGSKSLWDRGLLSGASQKSECISVFHIGETILSLQVRRLKDEYHQTSKLKLHPNFYFNN